MSIVVGVLSLVLVFLPAFALFLHRIETISVGATVRILPGWDRGFLAFVGVVSLVASLVILFYPGVGLLSLVVILSVSLLLNGLEAIAAGLRGVWRAPRLPKVAAQ